MEEGNIFQVNASKSHTRKSLSRRGKGMGASAQVN